MGQGAGDGDFSRSCIAKKTAQDVSLCNLQSGFPNSKTVPFSKRSQSNQSPMSTDPRLSPLTIDYTNNCSLAGEQTEKEIRREIAETISLYHHRRRK